MFVLTVTSTQLLETDDQALRERVRELIATTLLMDPADLPDDASQETCPRWTSLYHMMLLTVLEDEFAVTFSLDEMTSLTSLPAIVKVLAARGAGAV
jgi:acyl carrier protein